MNKPLSALEATLLILEGENTGGEIKIESPKEYIIGRSENCDIFVGEKKVSRKHAKLVASKEGLFIEDLDSTNGTFVEGKKITNQKLKDGESLRIGMTVFKVSLIENRALTEDGDVVADSSEIEGDISEHSQEVSEHSVEELDSSFDLLASGAKSVEKSPEELAGTIDGKESMEFELSQPIASDEKVEESSVSKSKRKPLTGDLSEMALPDILQMLKNNQRSGALKISSEFNEGKVYFQKGSLIGARFGKAQGVKAIYRLLTLNEGEFELEPLDDNFDESLAGEKITLPLENILLEGMRQLDELEKIKKGLPSMGAALEINKSCTQPLSKLHPRVLDILQLVLNHGVFSEVMDQSPLPDLETSKIVYYLVKKEYIQVG